MAIVNKAKWVAPGIIKLGPYGPYRNCVWLLVHQSEAAVLEMPPYRPRKDAQPWRAVKRLAKGLGVHPRYALLSHAHLDHCQSIVDFRKALPETRFVAHATQAYSSLMARLAWSAGFHLDHLFEEVFDGEIRLLDLAGEPLILLHAPKHSQSDVMVIFRGTAFTGDWFLGDLKDCNALVHPAAKIEAIESVQRWLRRLDYSVERAFSAHGDCLYYQVDFMKLLDKSKIDHGRRRIRV